MHYKQSESLRTRPSVSIQAGMHYSSESVKSLSDREGPVDNLSSLSQQRCPSCDMSVGVQQFSRGYQEIKGEISQQIASCPIYCQLSERKLLTAREKREGGDMSRRQVYWYTQCITYKHTKKHRHIIHTAWTALSVNFSSLYSTIQGGRKFFKISQNKK